MSSWTTDDTDALASCGHCDNCTRPPELVDHREVTLEAWQILKVASVAEKEGGRLTMSMLADLVRGNRGGSIEIDRGKGKGKRNAGGSGKEKVDLDLDALVGGKIRLSKDVRSPHRHPITIILFYRRFLLRLITSSC
jgi:ATP-dependent DNA helicase Q1